MALRLQKKMLGMTVKSKEKVKSYIDETTGELLDHLYDFAALDSGDEKTAKKVLKVRPDQRREEKRREEKRREEKRREEKSREEKRREEKRRKKKSKAESAWR